MRIALVDTNPRPEVYPVALLKLGAWRKSLGDKCVLFADTLPSKRQRFDEIWLTTTFTFDLAHSLGMAIEAQKRAKIVRVGGVAATLLPAAFEKYGLDVHCGLVPEAEAMAPDYSLMDKAPSYSITHTSRGCVRKCGFCMVRKLEPKFAKRPDWEKDLAPGAKKIMFYDNNWLAKPAAQIARDCDKIRALQAAGRINWIDFNQGLDARLFTDEKAALLKGLPFPWLRFAFDGMQEDVYFQDACRRALEYGFREVRAYALWNFRDTPGDLYYRLRECARMSGDLDNFPRVKAFPMRYQPILEADSGRHHIGIHWTKKMSAGFPKIISSHSGAAGMVCPLGTKAIGFTAMDEFEFWFGKDAPEFIRLLSYPKLAELLKKKTVELRMKRAPDIIRRRKVSKAKKAFDK